MRPRRPGFTLIELLVVIAILALLVAIAGPALASARGAASSIVCVSNTSQLAKAATMYAQDNRDTLWFSNRWMKIHNKGRAPSPGLIHEYIASDDVFECPTNRRRRSGIDHGSNHPSPNLFADRVEVDTDYTTPTNISGLRLYNEPRAAYRTDPSQHDDPYSRLELDSAEGLEMWPGLPLFVEESTAWSNEEDGWNTWTGPDQLTRRHGGAAIAFQDTHAESFLAPGGRDEMEPEKNDFTAQDVYVSVDSRSWHMLGWIFTQPNGWINSPRPYQYPQQLP